MSTAQTRSLKEIGLFQAEYLVFPACKTFRAIFKLLSSNKLVLVSSHVYRLVLSVYVYIVIS